jgi:predicted phage terminase large subunit-like protein
MTTWGVFKPTDGPMSVLLIDCWAEHLTFPLLKPKVLDEWRVSYGEGKDAKRPDLILVEDKAAGISLIQELRQAHLPVRAWNPGRADKMQRLQITASIFATQRVWLPESSVRKGFVKDWAEGFLSQICSFPDSTHDDYVDSATQAIRLLKDMGFLDINPEPRYDDEDDYYDVQPKRVNPYAV